MTKTEKITAFNKLKNNTGIKKFLFIINFNIIINNFFLTKNNNYNVDQSQPSQISH